MTVSGNNATLKNNGTLNSTSGLLCEYATGWIRASINGTNLYTEWYLFVK